CDRLIALDLERGRVRWERVVGDPERSFEYFWAPPLVHGGRLYAGVSSGSETLTRGRIVCVDAATGKPLWTFFTVPAAVSGGAVIASPALDPRSGALYGATGHPVHHRSGGRADRGGRRSRLLRLQQPRGQGVCGRRSRCRQRRDPLAPLPASVPARSALGRRRSRLPRPHRREAPGLERRRGGASLG